VTDGFVDNYATRTSTMLVDATAVKRRGERHAIEAIKRRPASRT
jgi:hypothetical protein